MKIISHVQFINLTLNEYIGLNMHHAITGYFQNDAKQWIARLDCGHDQTLIHNPPVTNNAWVLTQTGRDDKIGVLLVCTKCIAGVSPDRQFSSLLAKEAA